MKKQVLTHLTALVFVANTFAKTTPVLTGDFKQELSTGISFTENKGQVHDQDYKPRPDVLYGAMAGNMTVHIKRNGISYQLYKVDKYKEAEDHNTREKRQGTGQQTIYRIDLSWLNHNTNFTQTEDEVLPGFNNYYLPNCPNGALYVKSYKGITLNNLYNGINLHYYEKNGELKHDYIVAPHADYKQIQLQVDGADLSINKDGSLILITPLGKVQEGAPIVYQNNRQLKAKWLIKNNTLSFEVENYNSDYELIIDPVTRLWGTYYKSTGYEKGNACATDPSGNVYLAGETVGSSGTDIATVGSHQSASGGGTAFLVKFDANGVRQWGTYYGGGTNDIAYSCATDASGNVYMAGNTNSSTGIASVGAYLQAPAGNGDVFLVKFNASGVRQWGTYYGGTGYEYAYCCATDINGNVYLSGASGSSIAGTSVATAGSHQSTYAGAGDAFLVKFDANGNRLWGTFYGGAAGTEVGRSCATDALGNVYMAGQSGSNSSGTAVATVGSHQPVLAGGNDAFLVKFDANGTRLWGTFYGGSAGEVGSSCATDANNNVYLAGYTSSPGSVLATVGSHLSTTLGNDGFLAKFDANGNRLWATYYGGNSTDNIFSCATDAAGNIFIAGSTSSGGGTGVVTVGCHQPTYGGSTYDAFLVKFNSSGVRQCGTYYGGSNEDIGYSCVTDISGNVYLAGYTASGTGTVIATVGSHQPTLTGPATYAAFLVKFAACNAPAQPSAISGNTVLCSGSGANSYSVAPVAGATSYTWSLPTGWSAPANTNSISVTPGFSGIFTLIAGSACGASPQQTLNVTVNLTPLVTINSGGICPGESFTLVAGGANTYTYSSGPVVTPGATTSYSVTGTNTLGGCSYTATGLVTVNPLPIVSVNSGAICVGQTFILVASGADTYIYSSGPVVVSPTITTSYSVTGTSAAGCVSSNTAVSTVTVNPLPTINVSTTNTVLCVGENATLTASGASSYTFSPGGVGTISIVSPTTTSTYTVNGTDVKGCRNTATITQKMDECTGLNSQILNQNAGFIKLYPNPTKGIFNLELDSDNEVIIINAIGQIVYTSQLGSGYHQINLENLAKGIYVVKVANAAHSINIKVIKE